VILATETDKAYIAGIIDGEGCLLITERGRPSTRRCKTPSFVCTIVVSMTDEYAVQFIGERYKGRVRKYHRDGKRPYFTFDASCAKEVGTLAMDIQPYIKVKSRQVAAMLEYLSLPKFRGGLGHEVPANIVEKRRFWATEMHSLNQRMV